MSRDPFGPPLHPTPRPGEIAAAPARPKLPNGLYVWDPGRDSDRYWSQPWPMTPEQMAENQRALRAPLRERDYR